MSNRLTNIIAVGLLVFVFVVCVLSIRNDSLTMDELAHLPAGYSYLTQKDMRLNPEHPPLIKDLSAIPLLFINGSASSPLISFPSQDASWQTDLNGQWVFGNKFLFWSDNPTEKMIFWGRIPMILLLVLLGFYVFKWAREFGGNKAGILSLLLFSLSPTLLAHGRLVTTDVAAAFGFFTATYYFLKFLAKPDWKKTILAGVFLGIALLLKFSTFILLPLFGLFIIFWAMIKNPDWRSRFKSFFAYCLKFIIILIIAVVLIWLVYIYHVWNYPQERQISDIDILLTPNPLPYVRVLALKMASIDLLRPLAQYLLGLAMVFHRGVSGNTTYFLGEVSTSGWKTYFPIVYLLKETIVFHALSAMALILALFSAIKAVSKGFFPGLKTLVVSRFREIAMLIFIAFYWFISISGNLNIGVRHLLPVFPFTIVLIAIAIAGLLKPPFLKLKTAFLAALICFQAFSVLRVFPSFLAYFNEFVGGPDQGYKYVVDSNLDWGQDLKRLNQWLEENKIDKVYLDYFGGSDAIFYLGDKYMLWHSAYDPVGLSESSYLAISATFLQNETGEVIKGSFGHYRWLISGQYQPVAKIGYSIFVYKIR